MVSLQHFKPRSRFLLFFPSSSIACISISAALWNFALILLSLQHFKPISRFLLCLEVIFFSTYKPFFLFLPSFSIACISISTALWNFALILLSLQHFKPRSRFLLFLLSTSIACISISAALSFFLAFVSLKNLNKVWISVGCLLLHI